MGDIMRRLVRAIKDGKEILVNTLTPAAARKTAPYKPKDERPEHKEYTPADVDKMDKAALKRQRKADKRLPL